MNYPHQKDIVWINFDPSSGKEIQKRRPALVLSSDSFNESTGFCIVCPITSTNRNYGTYIRIKDPQKVSGEVVTHQIRSLDFKSRNYATIEQVDLLTWFDVLEVVGMFMEP